MGTQQAHMAQSWHGHVTRCRFFFLVFSQSASHQVSRE